MHVARINARSKYIKNCAAFSCNALGNFACFFVVCRFFSKSTFLKNSFSNFNTNTIRVSNSLDPDQAQHFVEPHLGPNCLQKLSADDTSSLVGKELMH